MFVNSVQPNTSWSSLDMSDHSSRSGALVSVNIVFLAAALTVVSLRAFTKIFMATRLFVDDFLIIAAAASYTIFCALNLHAATIGFGSHVWNLPGISADSTAENISEAAAKVQKVNFVALIMVAPAIILGKLSVVAILLRVFPPTMRALRYSLYGLGVVIIACCTAQALMIIFQCSPVQSSWDISSGSCYIEPLDVVIMGMGALNTTTDILICLTPIPYFMRLNIPTPQKLCVCGLFMSGIIACVISIVRWVSLLGLSKNLDVTYATIPYFTWSTIEVGLIIMTASFPSLRPLLATILPDFFRERNFSSLFNTEKRKSNMALGKASFFSDDSSQKAMTSSTGTITITKEYEISNDDMAPPRAHSTTRPITPLSAKLGPRAIVTCERVSSQRV